MTGPGITKVDVSATAFCVLFINAFWDLSVAQEVVLLGCAAAILIVVLLWRRVPRAPNDED